MSSKLYENAGITVDSTRYVVNGTTYPINSIASVNAKTISRPDEHSGSWLALAGLAIFGAFLLIVGIAKIIGVLIGLGLIVAAFAYAMKPSVRKFEDKYSVEIATSAGSTDTYTTSTITIVQDIVEAINEAIIARG